MQSYDLRVVIADDEPITKMDLAEILTGVGYKIAAEASDGFDAVGLAGSTTRIWCCWISRCRFWMGYLQRKSSRRKIWPERSCF